MPRIRTPSAIGNGSTRRQPRWGSVEPAVTRRKDLEMSLSPDEIEALVNKTLGRRVPDPAAVQELRLTVAAQEKTIANLREMVQVSDRAIAAQENSIRSLQSVVDMSAAELARYRATMDGARDVQ
jgi:uncharacterized coiled-coil protein SlyX